MLPLFYKNKNQKKERGGDMPRAPSEKTVEAQKLFDEGMKLTDIAKSLGVPEGTVRSWKNRGKWGTASPKKNECNVAKDIKDENATLQKRKRGGQPGNLNAKGGKGGAAPLRNKNAEKHGAYSKIYWDALDDEDLQLLDEVSSREEELLKQQIAMYSIRERKFMHQIKAFKEKSEKGLYVKGVKKKSRTEQDSDGNTCGKVEETSTDTEYAIKGLAVLEAEFTKVQRAKTKCIDSLIRLRVANERYDDLLNGWKSKAETINAAEDSSDVEDVMIYLPDNGRDKK